MRDGRIFVTDKKDRDAIDQQRRSSGAGVDAPFSDIVIIGAGAAGDAAAEMLRREEFQGSISLIGSDQAAPYDRPNLSKDYLAGSAPEEWLPLRSPGFYAEHDIDLMLETRATSIDLEGGAVLLSNGDSRRFDRLLLATGSRPIRLPIPGADLPHVHYLRSLADCRAIIAGAAEASRAVVIGASFIGMEAAASLRTRGLEVAVVAPESQPLERVLGTEIGKMIRSLHEEKGVRFHLQRTVSEIDSASVTVSDGKELPADIVVIGIGVRPETELAEQAGLVVDNGVVVNEFLETSRPGVFAAGDIARWPDPRSKQRVRIEHWVHAQRQGQVAARNMLGRNEVFDMAPFFWSQHYDVPIAYVGHAGEWDQIEVTGSVEGRDFLASFRSGGRTLAVASVYRDRESLLAEVALERGDESALTQVTH